MTSPVVLLGTAPGPCGDSPIEGSHSPVFSVSDTPVVIRAFGLADGEKACLEMVAGDHEGDYFEPVRSGCGCTPCLTACNNELVVATTGRYRLSYEQCSGTNIGPSAYIEYEEVATGALPNYGENAMSCGCETGSEVAVATNPDGSVVIVVDGVPTTIPASAQVSAVAAGSDTVILTVDGQTFQLDVGPDAPFVQTSGAPIPEGACVVTCADLADALVGVVADLVDPTGTPIASGDQVVTPTTLPALLADPSVGDDIAAALQLSDCSGGAIIAGSAIATCSDLSDAIAAIPADVFVNGVQSYDSATNVLTLTLTDGTTVDVPMSALVDDAVAEAMAAAPQDAITGVSLNASDELVITTGSDGAGPFTVSLAGVGTTSALTTNPDGSFSHSDGAGTVTTIPLSSTAQIGVVELASPSETGQNGAALATPSSALATTPGGVQLLRDYSTYPPTDEYVTPLSAVVQQSDGDKHRLQSQRGVVSGYRQEHDNTWTIWGSIQLGGTVESEVQPVTLPFPISNPGASVKLTTTRDIPGGFAMGDTLSGLEQQRAAARVIRVSSADNANALGIAWVNPASPGVHPGSVQYVVTGAVRAS